MSIILQGLTKLFGSQRVVDDVSLEIGEGELFVLLGPSGSGKSSILRLIAGLSRPNSGRVLLHGRDVTWLPARLRGVGFVFQNYSIFRHMTVDQNVEFGLRIRQVAKSERVRRREELLSLVGLAGLGTRRGDQLSGGQQQRVAIARALAYQPSVLLMDEPFGALDVKIRQQLRRNLQAIQKRLGVTTVLVTHDQDEAFELADRVGMIDRGRVMEVGPPEDVYARPRTLFTSTFLGAGTVLIGRADAGQAKIGPLSLPIPADIPHEDDSPVQILFRPEEVALAAEAPDASANVLGHGEVIGHNFAAALRKVRVRIDDLPHTRQVSPSIHMNAAVVDAVLPARTPLPSGERWVSLTGWHILEPPAPSILVCDRGAGSRRPLAVARELAWALHASVTVLAVGADAEDAETMEPRVKKRQHKEGLAAAELRVRFGAVAEEVSRQQAESLHELVVIAIRPRLLNRRPKRIGPNVQALLQGSFVPLLIPEGKQTTFARILVCAVPGPRETRHLRIAGRLAKRLGVATSLLRVGTPGESAEAGAAALERDRRTMKDVGVLSEPRQRSADHPAEAILAEARDGAYDLIVIGMPNPESRGAADLPELVSHVLRHADRSVLVIPAEMMVDGRELPEPEERQ